MRMTTIQVVDTTTPRRRPLRCRPPTTMISRWRRRLSHRSTAQTFGLPSCLPANLEASLLLTVRIECMKCASQLHTEEFSGAAWPTNTFVVSSVKDTTVFVYCFSVTSFCMVTKCVWLMGLYSKAKTLVFRQFDDLTRSTLALALPQINAAHYLQADDVIVLVVDCLFLNILCRS